MKTSLIACGIVIGIALIAQATCGASASANTFDHEYRAYADVLKKHLRFRRVDGDTLRVSSLFKWYGDDFTGQYAPVVPGSRDAGERGILGAIAKYGPPPAAELARSGQPEIRYLAYDWSLNDIPR